MFRINVDRYRSLTTKAPEISSTTHKLHIIDGRSPRLDRGSLMQVNTATVDGKRVENVDRNGSIVKTGSGGIV